MLGLGVGEILVIAALILVVVGPDRLPEMMRWAGKTYGQVRRAADELRRSLVLEADRMDAEERYRDLQRRREQAMAARRKAVDDAGPGVVPQDLHHPPVPMTMPEPPSDEASKREEPPA